MVSGFGQKQYTTPRNLLKSFTVYGSWKLEIPYNLSGQGCTLLGVIRRPINLIYGWSHLHFSKLKIGPNERNVENCSRHVPNAEYVPSRQHRRKRSFIAQGLPRIAQTKSHRANSKSLKNELIAVCRIFLGASKIQCYILVSSEVEKACLGPENSRADRKSSKYLGVCNLYHCG